MKSTRKMKILSILMSAVIVIGGAMPVTPAMAAADDDIVQNSENVDDVSADDTGITLSAYEGEDITGEPVVEETVPESGYVEDESAGSVENAAEEVPDEEVTDENEYGIQMLATATVSYVDADGTEQSPVTANVLTSSDTTWNAGWYVANSDVTISSRITVSGAVYLILADGCTLTASAGITVQGSNSLTIYGQTAGSGILEAETSVRDNAAIGGAGEYNSCGVVTINGGTVTAKTTGDSNGYAYGAGIGGGYRGNGGTININGGTVTGSSSARGIQYAAGIGGGRYEHGGNITISGGTVTASSGSQGAGIGGGSCGSGGNITISGGTVTATGYNGAGIGSGDATTNSSGADGGDITISGGEVTASSSNRGAGIGGGQNGSGGYITISGGTVTAKGSYYGAGIGGGKSESDGAYGSGGTIRISGGEVTASSSGYGAGIGGGEYCSGGNITISGGIVTATGNDGAGIGGGWYKSGGSTINISGGTVTATGSRGAGIGAGYQGSSGGSFTTGDNGHAFIVASSISDTSNKSNWLGAIIIGSSGQVYGTPTLTTDAEVPSGDTLLIPEDTGLTIGSDTTLTNSGTVYQNWGSTFTKNDSYVENGETYYQIINNIDIKDASLSEEGIIPYSDGIYSQVNNTITISLSEGGTLKQFNLTKNDGSSDTIDDSSFSMPDEPVELSGGVAMISIPEANTEEFTYNGTEQTYTLQESEYYTITGNVQTNAGTYTVTVTLNDTDNYVWTDGTTEDQTYKFVINVAMIPIPEANTEEFTYNGSKQTYTLQESEYYTIDGNVQTNAGTYTVTVTLKDKDNYVWEDETTEDQTYKFVINKADQSISYKTATVNKYDYDETFTNELTKTRVSGDVTYSFTTQSGDEPVIALDENSGEVSILGPGVVTVTATASGNSNYNQATASYILVVNADEISAEIDVNHDNVPYDDDKGEYVDELTYNGEDLELEMTLDLTDDEQSHLEGHEIAYQWSSYDFETDTFHKIDGANDSTYTLSGDAVNAGDYIYLCEAAVTYDNGYTHTVYSVIEITIDKAKQDISYDEDTLSKTITDEDFTNDLTKTVFSTDEDARITYTSSVPDVATVDEEGQVHILSAGETIIQATAVETDNYYEDTASYTLTVTDAALSATVTVNGDEKDYNKDTYTKTYDGKDVTLRVTPSSDSESESIDYTYQWSKDDEEIAGATDAFYTLSGGDVSDSGKYSCLVTAAYSNGNKAKVTVEVTVDITQAEMTKSMFTVDDSDETYTGDPITKEITSDLVEGTDYTVSYADNTNAGTATITITGTGNYTGELTYTFTILPADFGEGDITASGYSGVYDGKAHSITVTLSGAAEDATVTYSTKEDGPYTEKNPEFTTGTHTVYYKVSKDNYNEVTGSETVEITKLYIKTETTVKAKSDLVYNGTRQNAGIVVTATDGTVLEKDVDYILNGQTAKAAGTHKATITGIGKYYGTTTVNYKIAKADQKLTAKVKKTGTKKYTIKASKLKNDSRTFKIKVTKKGKMKVRYDTNNSRIKVDKDGKVTLKKGLKKGTYKIKVTTGASENYKASKKAKTITVKVK